MRLVKLASLLLLACFCMACASKADPPVKQRSPLEKSLSKEIYLFDDDEDQRIRVRQSVTEYLKAKHPDWKVQALSLNQIKDETRYRVGADVQAPNEWKFLELTAWFMIKDNGETYWKVTEGQ